MMQLNVIAFALHLISLINKFTQNVSSLTEDQSGKAKKNKKTKQGDNSCNSVFFRRWHSKLKTLCPNLLF